MQGVRSSDALSDARERQTRTALIKHLHEQRQFLRNSSDLFDSGLTAEAKRLATTVRVLVHDTSQAQSLLGQLGLKDKMQFIDTSLEVENLEPVRLPDGRYRVTRRKDAGLALIRLSGGKSSGFSPALGSRPRRRLAPFQAWWADPVLRDGQGKAFARRDLVLALAHLDGGAHVDPELPAAYAALSRSNSLGWEVHKGGQLLSLENPVLANVRQIAYEVRLTLEEQLPDELRLLPPAMERQAPNSGQPEGTSSGSEAGCGNGSGSSRR